MEPQQILETIIKSKTKTLSQLLSSVGTEQRNLVELQIMMLARDGVLSLSKQEGGDYFIKVIGVKAQNNVTKSRRDVTWNDHRTALVATLPTSLHKEFESLDTGTGVAMTDKVFKSLLRGATTYVKMCLPFPEEPAVSFFADEIVNLARANIGIKILTREVLNEKKFGSSYGNLLKALLRVYDIYRAYGDIRKLEVRDFHLGLKSKRFESIHYESVHGKVILTDGIKCYLGSGEWRVNSLYNNFEIGVLLSGSIVHRVESVFDLVWRHAKTIGYDFLKNAAGGARVPR